MEYSYKTENVCPKLIKFSISDNKIKEIQFLGGGCSGNLQALSKLVNGMEISEVIQKLSGIKCGMKSTSCANELAKALAKVNES